MRTPVKKYRQAIKDKIRECRFVIYSDKKKTKKQLIAEVRRYIVNRHNPDPMPGDSITIVSDD